MLVRIGGSLPVSFFSPQYEVSVASTYWGSLPELMEWSRWEKPERFGPTCNRFPSMMRHWRTTRCARVPYAVGQ